MLKMYFGIHTTIICTSCTYMRLLSGAYMNYMIRALQVTLHVSLLNVVPPIEYRASSSTLS